MDASIVSNGSSPTADAAARVDSVVLTRRRLNARRSRSSSNAESAGTMCAPAWFGWWREAARGGRPLGPHRHASRPRAAAPPPRALAPPGVGFDVRPAADAEFEAVAALRADAYYEDQPGGGGRFVQSYKRQFREQEAASLRTRTRPAPPPPPATGWGVLAPAPPAAASPVPECACLAAVDGGTGAVLGALDVRPPACAGGAHPAGVPTTDPTGAAVLNVAVAPSARRRGVGRALMRAAAALARSAWGAASLYTTVAASNEGARALYEEIGFGEVGEESAAWPGQTSLGREILLRADVDAAAADSE